MTINAKPEIALDTDRAHLGGVVKEIPPAGKRRSIGIVALVATLGSFLFGYDTGVISGALPYMYMPFGAHGLQLTANEEGWIGGTLLIGAALGALIGGRLSDRYGRRHNILLLAGIFAVGAIGTALAPNVWVMYPMRLILGFAVGGASATVPVYLSETAPKRIRGRIVAIDQVMIVTGQLLAFSFNALIDNAVGGPELNIAGNTGGMLGTGTQSWDNVLDLQTSQGGPLDPSMWHAFVNALVVDGGNGMAWRLMLLLCTIPAIALWIGMRFMPESPRWYAANKRYYEAVGALKQVRDPERDGDPADEMDEMLQSHRREVGQKKGNIRRYLVDPMVAQAVPGGSVPRHLQSDHRREHGDVLRTQGAAICGHGHFGLDHGTDRQWSHVSDWLLHCAVAHRALPPSSDSHHMSIQCVRHTRSDRVALRIHHQAIPHRWRATTVMGPMVILAMMGLFMLVVQAGNGPVVWTMLGEMFPSRVRGIANGTAVFCMWMVNALITATFPTMMENLGGGVTYGIYAVINLIFAFVLIRIMPETSGKSLEEIEVYAEARYS